MPKDWKRRALHAELALRGGVNLILSAVPDRPGHIVRLLPGETKRTTLTAVTPTGMQAIGVQVQLLATPAATRVPALSFEEESSGELLARLGTDGELWAAAFGALTGLDATPGLQLHGWFVNAIEAGITEGERRERGRREAQWPVGPELADTSPDLIRVLNTLGDEYGVLGVLGTAEKLWPAAAAARDKVKARRGAVAVKPEPSRPLSADVAAVAYAHSGVPTPMSADEAQARHDGFTAAIRESEQRIAAAVEVDQLIVDPVAAGIIGTMAYTSRQQQAEIDRLRREQTQMIALTERIVTERDNARTQLDTLTEAHERMIRERDEVVRQRDEAFRVLDGTKAANARLSRDLATALNTPQDEPLRDRVRPS